VTSLGVWEGLPQGREQRTYQFNDNMSVIVGQHAFKFGGEYYRLQADSFFDALQRPLLQFANFEDFQAGRPSTLQQRFGNSTRENRVTNVFAFVAGRLQSNSRFDAESGTSHGVGRRTD
jgi:hypothetical protein